MSAPDLLGSGSDREDRRPALRRAALALGAAALLTVVLRDGTDGPPEVHTVDAPTAVGADLYVSSCAPGTVYRVTADGALAPLAGTPGRGTDDTGAPVAAGRSDCPDGLLFDAAGLVHVVGPEPTRLRLVGEGGTIRSLAGEVTDPRRALGLYALLASPDAVGVGRDGTLYVGSTAGSRVRRLGADGRIGPLAPGAPPLPAVQEPARAALIAVDDDLSAYFADGDSDRVFRVDRAGRVTPAVGTGATGSSGDDGPALAAGLSNPRSVAIDPAGRLYVSEGAGRRVRVVAVDGTISTLAGSGPAGSAGDGGPGALATFTSPGDLALTGPEASDLCIVDLGAGAVRRIDPNGMISTLGS